MTKISEALTYGLTIRESATDGSDFTNPVADYRRLFLGEDGYLHLRDSSGTVTGVAAGASGIAESLLDAKGDIIAASAADTAAKLSVGSNGTVLTAASGEATGLKWAGFVGARYTTTAAQSITTGAAAAIVDFGTSVFDTDSAVTTGASWAFTAPVTGYYLVNARCTFAGSTAWAITERAWLQLYADGAQYATLDRQDQYVAGAGSPLMTVGGTALVYLVATHYIDIRIAQNSGSNIALTNEAIANYVEIAKLG